MRALGRMVLVVAITSCKTGQASGEAPGAGAEAEAFCGDYGILGVQIDPATYHWADPAKLLDSAEGAGPRTLNVAVSSAVSPQISVTGTYTPPKTDFSKALGWDVTQTITLAADSSVLIPVNAYARVDAYPSYQKATATIGAYCDGQGAVVLGSGEVLKPVGIYFDTCGCIGPDPCGVGCVSGFPFGGGSPAANSGGNSGGNSGDSAGDNAGSDADAGASDGG